MISWEQPQEQVACPHCGSKETQLWLQLLGVTRYSCNGCRKSFAVDSEKTAPGPGLPKAAPASASRS